MFTELFGGLTKVLGSSLVFLKSRHFLHLPGVEVPEAKGSIPRSGKCVLYFDRIPFVLISNCGVLSIGRNVDQP